MKGHQTELFIVMSDDCHYDNGYVPIVGPLWTDNFLLKVAIF